MLYSVILVIGILLLSALCFWLGLRISRLKKFWFLGFVIPFAVYTAIIVVRKIPDLNFVVPFSYLTFGRNEFVILAISTTTMLGTLIPRLRTKGQKNAATLLVPFAAIYFVVPPFLGSALLRNKFENLKSFMDDGVCMQSTGFTCGPASAVTALNQFGIEAKEGQIAIESYTTRTWGVPENLLAAAIEKMYGDKGIRCEYRHFDSPDQLKDKCPTITTTKFEFLIDHYVTVLDVGDDYVEIGDPLKGRIKLTYNEFEDIWRYVGIVVTQNTQ